MTRLETNAIKIITGVLIAFLVIAGLGWWLGTVVLPRVAGHLGGF